MVRTTLILASLAVTRVFGGQTVFDSSSPVLSDPSYRSLTTTSNPDWMAAIPDTTSLTKLSIPGTHESLAIVGTDVAECQENFGISAATLSAQLTAGIRAIDIRLRIESNNTLVVHHGVVYQHANLDDVFSTLAGFLSAHPKESILLRMKQECTGEFGSCTDVSGPGQLAFVDIIDTYIARRSTLFWAPSTNRQSAAELPTLGQIRGRVLLMALHGPHGGRYASYGLAQFVGWNDGNSTYVQDNYDVPEIGAIPTKRDQVRRFLDAFNSPSGDPTALYVNFCSGASLLALPYQVAGGVFAIQGVNPFLLSYLGQTAGGSTHRTSVTMMDFPGGALIERVLAFNPS
ncbi:1-phosphatidylinositol phosphodiesterase [Mycena amicta]|nr:1-phosphatidylinositol phosphodiesterase [Mycena amicta]